MTEPKKKAAAKPETSLPEPAVEVDAGGKTWQISPEAVDDFEVLDDLARWDDGDISRMPVILRRLLGGDQNRAAMDLMRDEKTGRVSMAKGAEFLQELLAGLNPN